MKCVELGLPKCCFINIITFYLPLKINPKNAATGDLSEDSRPNTFVVLSKIHKQGQGGVKVLIQLRKLY